MKHKKFFDRLGVEAITDIIENAHQDAIYYVDEWNEHFKAHGYCTDKCIIGLHNPHTHYRLDRLRSILNKEQGALPC